MQKGHAQSISTGYLLQKNYINKIYTLSDSVCQQRKIVIPKHISLDKEQLYEELIQEKRRNKLLLNEISKLKAKLQCYEKDLVIQGEVDYRRELKQALVRLKNKEEDYQQLLEHSNHKKVMELEKTLHSTKQELEKYHVYQNFDGNTEQIINDNILLFQKIELQNQQIKELERIRMDYIAIIGKNQKLQQVIQGKDLQLQKYRSRDLLSDTNKKSQNKNENILKEELSAKEEEIEHLRTQLIIANKANVQDKNLLESTQQELQQKINQHEYEKQGYKEKIENLKKDIQSLSEKARSFDRYLSINPKRKTLFMDDQHSQSQHTQPQDSDQMVRSVQKSQIEDISNELRLSLRSKNISLTDAEQLLFKGEEISITELENLLSREPFKVLSSNTLSRYMVEEYQEKEFEYNSELKASIPQVRSIFRTLLQQYSLQFDQKIIDTVNRSIQQIIDYCQRKSLQKLTHQILMDCVQQLELQWTSKHFDYFQQQYYNKYQGFLQFDITNLHQLFEQQLQK